MTAEAKPRLLVQEDAPQIARIIHFKLTYEGYAVQMTEEGEATLKQVAENRPALLVLDAEGPGLSGWEVLRRLRGRPEESRLPIIFLLENDDRDRAPEALALGASDCVIKPFRPTQLAKKVKALL